MSDRTDAFFDALGDRGHVPSLAYVSGTFAFEITNGKSPRRWFVDVRKGNVAVSRTGGPADVTLRADQRIFERIVTGRSSPMTAVLRGEVTTEGDPRLLVLLRRLLPDSP